MTETSQRDVEQTEGDRERRDLALASLSLALASIPKWSATRRALETRLRWLKATETLTADQLTDEADRMLEKALRWKQHDQTARVTPKA